mmetsp:Transcript_152/g.282  ORF Transcript_152/g.282 Transcript_152/m.282 type:complete len:120 (+) Transcript_152:260-619(+)
MYKAKVLRYNANKITIVKYLIEQGAPLDALNEEKLTPFDVALQSDSIATLGVLSESIKLSEKPEILHSLATKFFNDHYKEVLTKMLGKEDSSVLTPEKINILDGKGMTPLQAYLTFFVS